MLARALEAGVSAALDIADSPEEWQRTLALCRASGGPGRPVVRCALGLHPYHADADIPALAQSLARVGRLPEVAAVGEIGLDYAKCKVLPETQKRAFLALLGSACGLGLPVIVHSRDAFPDTLDLLEAFYRERSKSRRFRGVLHCFSGGAEEALRGVALGFALGVDGPVTYPNNGPLRAALKEAGLGNLVLETDSPYLPPQSCRGRRNEPAALREIARGLAAALGAPEEEVARVTSENARALFGL